MTWKTITATYGKAQRAYENGLRFTAYRTGYLVIADAQNMLVYEAHTATQAAAKAIASEYLAIAS